jgi:hypothetical protein
MKHKFTQFIIALPLPLACVHAREVAHMVPASVPAPKTAKPPQAGASIQCIQNANCQMLAALTRGASLRSLTATMNATSSRPDSTTTMPFQ